MGPRCMLQQRPVGCLCEGGGGSLLEWTSGQKLPRCPLRTERRKLSRGQQPDELMDRLLLSSRPWLVQVRVIMNCIILQLIIRSCMCVFYISKTPKFHIIRCYFILLLYYCIVLLFLHTCFHSKELGRRAHLRWSTYLSAVTCEMGSCCCCHVRRVQNAVKLARSARSPGLMSASCTHGCSIRTPNPENPSFLHQSQKELEERTVVGCLP